MERVTAWRYAKSAILRENAALKRMCSLSLVRHSGAQWHPSGASVNPLATITKN